VEGVDLYFCVGYEHVGAFMINNAQSFYSSFLWVNIVCGALLLYGFSLLDVNQGQEEFGV
jgi:hypothetical protein